MALGDGQAKSRIAEFVAARQKKKVWPATAARVGKNPAKLGRTQQPAVAREGRMGARGVTPTALGTRQLRRRAERGPWRGGP